MKKVIDNFSDENSFLSNFHPCIVKYEGLTYRSSEAAFQAAKCANPNDRLAFVFLSPGEAKRKGRTVTLRADWESEKINIMRDICRIKFESNRELKNSLIRTAGYELVEGNWWKDYFWGVCDGRGRNELGKILMSLREGFIEEVKGELFNEKN